MNNRAFESEHAGVCSFVSREISLSHLISLAYHDDNEQALEALQQRLAELHAGCFSLPTKLGVNFESLRCDTQAALEIEKRMTDHENRFIDMRCCPTGDVGGEGFVSQLRHIIREHPANNHPF